MAVVNLWRVMKTVFAQHTMTNHRNEKWQSSSRDPAAALNEPSGARVQERTEPSLALEGRTHFKAQGSL